LKNYSVIYRMAESVNLSNFGNLETGHCGERSSKIKSF
jgi:hypothetical protein